MPKQKMGFLGKTLHALTAAQAAYKQLSAKEADENQWGYGYNATDRDFLNMFSESFMRANADITFAAAVLYYCRVEPVSSGVDWIADSYENIPPVIYNYRTKEFEKADNPLLQLLRFPNADVSGGEFRKQLSAYYSITGNCYIVATGTPGKPALELAVIQPQRVAMSPAPDGYVGSYTVSAGAIGGRLFERKEVDGRFRYYSSDGAELWHIRNFNPRYNPSQLYGMSKLNPVFYEMEQHLKGNIHNLSLLTKGNRASGALITDAELSPEQRDRLRAELNNQHAGAENAGRIFLFEALGGTKTEFHAMSQTAKDSDYLGNRTAITTTIFNRLKIPIPLISPEHMTMDNYAKALIALYDCAVLPQANLLNSELTIFLGPRYKLAESECLTYDVADIPALEPRRNEQTATKKSSGVLTINEIRTLLGYEAIEGGDALYQPLNFVPVGTDRFTGDNITEPKPRKLSGREMYALLKRQLGPNGEPRFTEAQLTKFSEAVK
jgi:HK97 family phage portal protein